MAAGFVTLTVGDGNGGTFSARFWSSDGTAAGLIFPAPVLTDPAGAQAIGTVGAPEAGTLLKLLADSVAATQAIRDANNTINVAGDVSTLYQGATALTIYRDFVDASTSGDNEIVPAQGAGNKILVLAYEANGAGAVNAHFRSATTPISCVKTIAAAGGGLVSGYSPVGWFATAANEALNLNLSAAVAVGCDVVYTVIT